MNYCLIMHAKIKTACLHIWQQYAGVYICIQKMMITILSHVSRTSSQRFTYTRGCKVAEST